MSFKDLNLKNSYTSYGEENFADAFINPALRHAKVYQRSVGFFSSTVFQPIVDGIVALSRNGGKFQLIASPKLTEDDIKAIELGYKSREEIVNIAFNRDFLDSLDKLGETHLQLLAQLIANGTMDIKIAVTLANGIYHDKLGILEDFEGNAIAFYGSANETLSGYKNNYEKIRLEKNWTGSESDKERVEEEQREFQALWNNTNEFLEVYPYTESAKKNIVQVIERKSSQAKSNNTIKLRDYQEKAIEAWTKNNYKGFYVMATGTGKTWTAIYSAKKLLETNSAMIVICAPYKHLIRQWGDDLEKVFEDAKIIMVSSENAHWEKELTNAIISKKYNDNMQIIVVTTIVSFNLERFSKAINKSEDKKLLIVDEAHRFTNRPEALKETYQYMLGLSATPFSGKSAEKGLELMKFFDGQVFNLPIEEALDREFLVPYNYYPIFVNATEDEEGRFKYHTQQILSCFKYGKCINPEKLAKELRNRLRVISMADEKMRRLEEILSQVKEKDHLIVYCGDGKLYDSNTGAMTRHINAVKKKLHENNYKPSQFTAQENMKERMELVDAFNKGDITALAAIRCLDEGINIPSIKGALILSSNDDYREFVQRRGRILRLYDNKEFANIYDVIVLPSQEMDNWAKIEFRRFYEYAKLALNWRDLEPELESHLAYYGLETDDIDVFDYEDEMEATLDE